MGETMNKWMGLWDKVTEMKNILCDKVEVKFVLGDLYTCLNITKTKKIDKMSRKGQK